MDLLAKMTTYVRVIEAGSLSAAAKQLRISPAAASRQLAALEAGLGAQLVARSTRRMTVTVAGRAYYESCLRVLREVDDAQAAGRGTTARGPVVISAPLTFGLASVVPRLRELIAKQPAIRLDLRLEDRVIDLALEGVDVAIRVGSDPPLSTELVAHRLTTWARVLVASPGYLRKRGTPKTPAALAGHDALSHALDAAAETWRLVNGDARHHVRVAVRCASNSGHALRELALDGRGVAMLPPWFVAADVAARRLRTVLAGWHSEPITAHALYRARHRSERDVRAFVEHLRASYAADDAGHGVEISPR